MRRWRYSHHAFLWNLPGAPAWQEEAQMYALMILNVLMFAHRWKNLDEEVMGFVPTLRG